ncbi:unnamed protein product [Brassicogethes aeneus]|uniref:C2H2-type domain-containing protein n=1 Tax=Brassicogethes aeneus TaxID=1431903 RepID=A0A9P0FDN8_BRAAE|nr:unnamed protein product [Brassicogethes aeneus]
MDFFMYYCDFCEFASSYEEWEEHAKTCKPNKNKEKDNIGEPIEDKVIETIIEKDNEPAETQCKEINKNDSIITQCEEINKNVSTIITSEEDRIAQEALEETSNEKCENVLKICEICNEGIIKLERHRKCRRELLRSKFKDSLKIKEENQEPPSKIPKKEFDEHQSKEPEKQVVTCLTEELKNETANYNLYLQRSQCPYCSAKEITQRNIIEHVKTCLVYPLYKQRYEKKRYKLRTCGKCFRTFASKKILCHHDCMLKTKYPCPFCGLQNTNMSSLLNHINYCKIYLQNKEMFKKGDNAYKKNTCKDCFLSFEDERGLQMHECYILGCQKLSILRKKNEAQVKTVAQNEPVTYNCDKCKTSFKKKQTFVEHIIKNHSIILCSSCNSIIKNISSYFDHKIKCAFERFFKSKIKEQTIDGVEYFSCKCGVGLNDKDKMMEHLKCMHPNFVNNFCQSTSPLFGCDQCRQLYGKNVGRIFCNCQKKYLSVVTKGEPKIVAIENVDNDTTLLKNVGDNLVGNVDAATILPSIVAESGPNSQELEKNVTNPDGDVAMAYSAKVPQTEDKLQSSSETKELEDKIQKSIDYFINFSTTYVMAHKTVYTCTHCDVEDDSLAKIKAHIRSHPENFCPCKTLWSLCCKCYHPIQSKMFRTNRVPFEYHRCEICEKKFSVIQLLIDHFKAKHMNKSMTENKKTALKGNADVDNSMENAKYTSVKVVKIVFPEEIEETAKAPVENSMKNIESENSEHTTETDKVVLPEITEKTNLEEKNFETQKAPVETKTAHSEYKKFKENSTIRHPDPQYCPKRDNKFEILNGYWPNGHSEKVCFQPKNVEYYEKVPTEHHCDICKETFSDVELLLDHLSVGHTTTCITENEKSALKENAVLENVETKRASAVSRSRNKGNALIKDGLGIHQGYEFEKSITNYCRPVIKLDSKLDASNDTQKNTIENSSSEVNLNHTIIQVIDDTSKKPTYVRCSGTFFKCTHCDVVEDDLDAIKAHLSSHPENFCSCGKLFSSCSSSPRFKDVGYYVISKVSIESHQCDLCKKRFSDIKLLVEHIKVEHFGSSCVTKPSDFSEEIKNNAPVENPMEKVLPENSELTRAIKSLKVLFPVKIKKTPLLERYLRLENASTKEMPKKFYRKVFQCKICDMFDAQINLARKHVKTHLEYKRLRKGVMYKTVYLCVFCRQKFTSIRDLESHSRSAHSKAYKTCPFCAKLRIECWLHNPHHHYRRYLKADLNEYPWSLRAKIEHVSMDHCYCKEDYDYSTETASEVSLIELNSLGDSDVDDCFVEDVEMQEVHRDEEIKEKVTVESPFPYYDSDEESEYDVVDIFKDFDNNNEDFDEELSKLIKTGYPTDEKERNFYCPDCLFKTSQYLSLRHHVQRYHKRSVFLDNAVYTI